MKGFWPAFAVGVPLGLVLVGALGFVAVRKQLKEARDGWGLRPVVVVAVDVAEGTRLTMDQISQRSIPEQFIYPSMITPDEASAVINKVVTVPMQAGDPLLWTSFVDPTRAARVSACALGLKPTVAPVVAEAQSKALAGITAPENLGEAPLTVPAVGADGLAQVVAATRDLAEGAVLSRGDLEVRGVDPLLATASWLSPADLDTAVGKRLVVPLLKGDGLWWQMMEHADRPSSPAGCERLVADATQKAQSVAGAREAKAWFEHEPPLKAPAPKEAP